jgi:hypothetical protein
MLKLDEVWFHPGPSCSLDFADAHPAGAPMSEVTKALGMGTVRRGEQIARKALLKLQAMGVNVDAMIESLEGE